MSRQKLYTTREVAEKAGITIDQLRYMIELGLVEATMRAPYGFLWSPAAVSMVRKIVKIRRDGARLRHAEMEF